MSTPRSRRPIAALALALAVTLALGAMSCSSDDNGGGTTTSATKTTKPVEVGAVLEGLADDVIIPSYQQLGETLTTLEADTKALCESPSPEALETAQQAWRDALVAWQGTRAAGVGPALDERLMSAVAFAARPRVITLLLEGTDPVDPASLSEEGAAGRGLYAAEEALFGEGSETLTTAEGARRCEYVSSVATLAAEAAAPVVEAWTDGDARQNFVDGLDGGPQSSVDAVVNEVAHRLEEIDGMGLRDMAAAKGPDDLDDTRRGGAAEYRVADRAALLAGISAVVGDGSTGLSALAAGKDADLSERLVAAQKEADDAMAALPDSVPDAFDHPDDIAAASKAVAALKVLVSTEVASQLGVTINFSDSDGDS